MVDRGFGAAAINLMMIRVFREAFFSFFLALLFFPLRRCVLEVTSSLLKVVYERVNDYEMYLMNRELLYGN